jgi:hypothetical protein
VPGSNLFKLQSQPWKLFEISHEQLDWREVEESSWNTTSKEWLMKPPTKTWNQVSPPTFKSSNPLYQNVIPANQGKI